MEFDEQPYSGVHLMWTIKSTTKITAYMAVARDINLPLKRVATNQ